MKKSHKIQGTVCEREKETKIKICCALAVLVIILYAVETYAHERLQVDEKRQPNVRKT